MYSYRFKLTPADRKAVINFMDLEEKHHFFIQAAENCNLGVTFKRAEKKITIEQIGINHIYLTLSSVTELSSPTRTLSAYSREIFRLDKDSSLLDSLVYNHTLFRTELIETIKAPERTIDSISSTELLKAIIDVLFSPSNSYNTKQKNETILKLKEIMLPFLSSKE